MFYNQEMTMHFPPSRSMRQECLKKFPTFEKKSELNFSSREREATKGNFSMFLSLFVQGKENNPM